MAKIFHLRRLSTAMLRRRKAALRRRLDVPQDFLRGSFVERFTTCGKPNCCCARGERHGPFYYLVSNLAPGHVWKVQLKEEPEKSGVRRALRKSLKHWEALEELSQINGELVRRGQRLEAA